MDVAAARDRGAVARADVPVWSDRVRRSLDIVLASMLLILCLPVLLIAAIAVLLFSGRPVFYGHVRVGRFGRSFNCWKLRTMATDAESRLDTDADLRRLYVDNGYKLPDNDDPRLTRVGRWMRRNHIDELPQLFNVIGGCMSLVGPRPVVAEELREFEPDTSELLSVRPGIVGAWTSRGRRRPAYPERAHLEIDYVRNHSVWRDVDIMLRSIAVVLRGMRGNQ